MNKKYVAKIGTPDAIKQLDSEGNREVLVSSINVYDAHKQAMSKCRGVEEVLEITINGNIVYTLDGGFVDQWS